MTNKISKITKLDIYDIFKDGIDIPDLWDTKKVNYYYYGRIEEIDFLKRLYHLADMESLDSRYPNAEGDIWQHTVNNADYPSCWVFQDKRFPLAKGSDEEYLKFICEVFHPEVRFDKGYWKEFLAEINKFLQNDGYEIYPSRKISNRDVFGWRIYKPEEDIIFLPYSQRNAKAISKEKIRFSINRSARYQIYQLLEKYNMVYRDRNETGFEYVTTISEDVFREILQFYVPKRYDDKKQYVDTDSLQDFILGTSPYCVMDAIEFFQRCRGDATDFEAQVNAILKLNGLALKLDNGKIINTYDFPISAAALAPIEEAGLKELMQEAAKYYDDGNVKIAVEKLWDAFERLKTYYSPVLDKKQSVDKIISDMSDGKGPYVNLFEKEFSEVTDIGNNFRIRHHEITKTNIEDKRHYEYFYKRCLSLILIACQYLNGQA